MNVIDWDGKKISKPGIYRGIPIDRYHENICDGPSISSSGLRQIFNESAAHYFVGSPYNPERDPEANKPNKGMILGRAAHHLFLEQKGFAKTFVVRPDESPDGRAWNGNNNSCKDWIKRHEAAGLTILTAEQMAAVIGMAKSLRKEPLIQAGILNGKVEHSMIVREPQTGIWLKSRPDVIPNDAHDFVDLKTSAVIDDEDLQGVIGDFGYNMQGALIGMVNQLLTGKPMTSFNLIFVETTAPYCVRAVAVKSDALKDGEDQCRAALKLFKRCMETGDWIGPMGHQTEMSHLGLKPWRAERNKYRLSLINRELKA